MSRRPAGSPVSLAMASTTGRKMATAAVLLMKAESRPMVSISTTMTSRKLIRAKRARSVTRMLTAPVRNSPAERTNIAPTVTVAGLLKPPMASWGVMSPESSRVAIRISAVRSTGSRSVAKRITAETSRPSTSTMSTVMRLPRSAAYDKSCPHVPSLPWQHG